MDLDLPIDDDVQQWVNGRESRAVFDEIVRLTDEVNLQMVRLSELAKFSKLIDLDYDDGVWDSKIQREVGSKEEAYKMFLKNFTKVLLVRSKMGLVDDTPESTIDTLQRNYCLSYKAFDVLAMNYVMDIMERANFDYYLDQRWRGELTYAPSLMFSMEARRLRYHRMHEVCMGWFSAVKLLHNIMLFTLCSVDMLLGNPEPNTQFDQWNFFVTHPDSVLNKQCRLVMLHSWRIHGFFEPLYETPDFYGNDFGKAFVECASNVVFYVLGKLILANTPGGKVARSLEREIVSWPVRPTSGVDVEQAMFGAPLVLGTLSQWIQLPVNDQRLVIVEDARGGEATELFLTVAERIKQGIYHTKNETPAGKIPRFLSIYDLDGAAAWDYAVKSRLALYRFYIQPEGRAFYKMLPTTSHGVMYIVDQMQRVFSKMFRRTLVDVALFGRYSGRSHPVLFLTKSPRQTPTVRDFNLVTPPVHRPLASFRRIFELRQLMSEQLPEFAMHGTLPDERTSWVEPMPSDLPEQTQMQAQMEAALQFQPPTETNYEQFAFGEMTYESEEQQQQLVFAPYSGEPTASMSFADSAMPAEWYSSSSSSADAALFAMYDLESVSNSLMFDRDEQSLADSGQSWIV